MNTMKKKNILLVAYDEEEELLLRLSLGELTGHFTCYAASNEKNVLAYLQQHEADIIITDICRKTNVNCKMIARVQKKYNIPVLILSSVETAKICLIKQLYVIGYIYKDNCYMKWSMQLRKMLLFFLDYRAK